ncbi:MAG: hypothetical protein ACK4RK_11165 [Gemmataceae bacterium]
MVFVIKTLWIASFPKSQRERFRPKVVLSNREKDMEVRNHRPAFGIALNLALPVVSPCSPNLLSSNKEKWNQSIAKDATRREQTRQRSRLFQLGS